MFQKIPRLRIGTQQSLDPPAQCGVRPANAIKIGNTDLRRDVLKSPGKNGLVFIERGHGIGCISHTCAFSG
jgi:hypothetical protein